MELFTKIVYICNMKIKLYHGTSTVYLPMIKKHGLIPRYNSKSNWKTKSRPDMIYLTSAYPIHFAEHAINEHGGKPVVLEVEVDVNRLYPDEDFLEQATRGMSDEGNGGSDEEVKRVKKGRLWNNLKGLDMEQRTKYFRDKLEHYKHHYEDSLRGLGTCCHKGIIKTKGIIRHVIPNKKTRAMSDPSIHIDNFRVLADYYAHLIKQMFNNEDPDSYWDFMGWSEHYKEMIGEIRKKSEE